MFPIKTGTSMAFWNIPSVNVPESRSDLRRMHPGWEQNWNVPSQCPFSYQTINISMMFMDISCSHMFQARKEPTRLFPFDLQKE